MAEPVTLYKDDKEVTLTAPSLVMIYQQQGWSKEKPEPKAVPEPKAAPKAAPKKKETK